MGHFFSNLLAHKETTRMAASASYLVYSKLYYSTFSTWLTRKIANKINALEFHVLRSL